MSRSPVRPVLIGLGAFLCFTGPLAGQQAQSPAAATTTAGAARPSNLAGQWQFDDSGSKEDQRNWRRPVGSTNPIPTLGPPPGGFGGAGAPGPVPPNMGGGGWEGGGYMPRPTGASFQTELRRTLRDLLEVAERYQISIAPDRVTIVDDLERELTFVTDGKKQKHRLGATSFDAKTMWDGALLKQDIEAIGGFHMSQVFLPTEDGQGMFVSIRVDKPAFNPPIKPITRAYRRSN